MKPDSSHRESLTRTFAAAMAGVLLCSGFAAAQAARQGSPPITSPEVLPDGRVTFRLLAPDATSVSVTGDWPGGIQSTTTPMVKDEKGVWSATVGPLKPEFWIYTFSVNGVTILDPRNINTRRNTTRIENTLLIPGPESADYAVNTFPMERSPSSGTSLQRSMPPGARTSIRLPGTRTGRNGTPCSTCSMAAAGTRMPGLRAAARARFSTT